MRLRTATSPLGRRRTARGHALLAMKVKLGSERLERSHLWVETDMHKLKLKQAVILVHTGRDLRDIYEIVRSLPDLPNGEAQYRIRGRDSGMERVVRQAEIRPVFQ